MTKTFSAQIADQVAEIEELMLAVFREAVQDTVEEMLEPGPSVASTKIAISKGIGTVGRGKRKKALAGPVARTGGGGNLPVDTGFLRASFKLSEGAPVARIMPEREDGKTYDADVDAYEAVINNADGRQKLYATFSAAYAAAVEYGSNGSRPRAFVRKAAQNWQRNVDRAVAKLKGGRRG